MKEKRLILFGLICVFMTSTFVALASANHEMETVFVENSETVAEFENNKEEQDSHEDKRTDFEDTKEKTAEEKEGIKDDVSKANEAEPADIATDSNAKATEPSTDEQSRLETDFDIEGTVLVKYNGTEEKVIVPDGVEIIGKEAFKGNPYVKELILSDTVQCAESEAFAYMENLEVIEKGAFFYTEYDDIYNGSDKLSQFNVRDNFY